MRTSYPNWSHANILATIVSTALIALPTLSCGLALLVQKSEMNTRRATILEMCNVEADAAAQREELPDVAAERARQALATCLDDRSSVPPAQRGNG
jgi:hypothetical protein